VREPDAPDRAGGDQQADDDEEDDCENAEPG